LTCRNRPFRFNNFKDVLKEVTNSVSLLPTYSIYVTWFPHSKDLCSKMFLLLFLHAMLSFVVFYMSKQLWRFYSFAPPHTTCIRGVVIQYLYCTQIRN
jgi:hypothetical protein